MHITFDIMVRDVVGRLVSTPLKDKNEMNVSGGSDKSCLKPAPVKPVRFAHEPLQPVSVDGSAYAPADDKARLDIARPAGRFPRAGNDETSENLSINPPPMLKRIPKCIPPT